MLVSIVPLSKNYPEIWDNFQVPDGIDKQNVIDSILMACGEMELLYSDPYYLAWMIKTWTNRELPVWTSLEETLHYKYNPIWNVEGSERETIDRTGEEERDLKNERTPDLTNTVKIAGYNENEPAVRDVVQETGKDTQSQTGKVGTKSGEVRELVRGMNLGVMTTQQLIREQRELVQFTVTEFITNSFKSTFCLMVY